MAWGQASSTIILSNGVELKVEADFGQPTGQERLTVEMARASGNSFYRIFWDQNHLAVFAYELAVAGRSEDGEEMQFAARPAGNEFAARFPNADAGKPVPTVSSERPLILRSGGKAEIGLFEIPGMGLSVKDCIQVGLDAEPSGGPFQFAWLKVLLNGMPVSGDAKRTPVGGRYAMFYVPGKGGYFFATESPSGRMFLKAGSVDRNRMKFSIDNQPFECIADMPILENAEGAEIWVFHDPSYKPSGNWTVTQPDMPRDEFFMAGADSLNWWLGP